MNRLTVWALAFSAGLNIVLLGMTVRHINQGSWPASPAAAAPRSSPAAFTLQFDEKRLQLTPQQHERFQAINDRWTEEEKKAKTGGVDRISRLSKVLVRDDASTATMQPEFAEIRNHSSDFFVRLTRALQEYRAELKPEQRVVFNQLLQERFAALQRFSRQRFFEYEQRITQSNLHKKKAEKRKAEKKGEAGGEKKSDVKAGEKKSEGKFGDKKGKGKKAGEKSGEKKIPVNADATPAQPAPTPKPDKPSVS